MKIIYMAGPGMIVRNTFRNNFFGGERFKTFNRSDSGGK
jgi:hypothetical protein